MSPELPHTSQVFTMDQIPLRWSSTVVSKLTEDFRVQKPTPEHAPSHDELVAQLKVAERLREVRWIESTGQNPEESDLTIVVPVHNEASNLETFMGAFLTSDIPKSLPVHVIFVTNNCTDDSQLELFKQLQKIGAIETESIELSTVDPLAEKEMKSVTVGRRKYVVITTPVGSKANALNIANHYALEVHPSNYLLNLDANNYVEPETVRLMYAAGVEMTSNSEKLLVDGMPVRQYKKQFNSPLSVLGSTLKDKFEPTRSANRESASIAGCCMLWDPKWYKKMGNLPLGVGDDYTLTVLAMLDGPNEPTIHTNAPIWVYEPIGLDRLRCAGRWRMQKLQLLEFFRAYRPDQHPDVLNIIREKRYGFDSFGLRFTSMVEKIIDGPRSPNTIARRLAKFVYQEITIAYGNYLYDKQPNSLSWDPIQSTK